MHVISDPNLLSPEQTRLIVAAAANRGALEICIRSNTYGRAVCAKKEAFCDPEDREVATSYIEAVYELEKVLLLRQAQSKSKFELTNFGWQISRKLKSVVMP